MSQIFIGGLDALPHFTADGVVCQQLEGVIGHWPRSCRQKMAASNSVVGGK